MKVELIHHDEGWVDVYIDGKHVHGAHDITPEQLLNLLAVAYTTRWVSEEESEALEGQYPGIGQRT